MWMVSRAVIFLVTVVLLSGCTTVNKKDNLQIQQLQSHLNYLESELTKQGEEIAQLKKDISSSAKPNDFVEYDPKAIDPDTIEATFPAPSATQLQQALKNAGFYRGTVDGKVGPKTSEAIMAFQKQNKLKADGVIGKKTWNELKKYLK